jgi:hypothetical protein
MMSTNEQQGKAGIVHVNEREDTRPSALPKDDSSPDLPHTKQEERTGKKSKKGRVAGGSTLKELHTKVIQIALMRGIEGG